jgi:hypothetical protein
MAATATRAVIVTGEDCTAVGDGDREWSEGVGGDTWMVCVRETRPKTNHDDDENGDDEKATLSSSCLQTA